MDFLDRDDIINGKFPEKDKTLHEILYHYASKGLTDDSLAMMMGMAISEFRQLRKNDAEIEKTILKARLPMITAIDKIAWELAMGNKKVKKTVIKTYPNGDVETTETESCVSPNVGMLNTLMKNFANYHEAPNLNPLEDEKIESEKLKTLLK